MSTHNLSFYGELIKIILQLSSNTLFIFSTWNGNHFFVLFFYICFPDLGCHGCGVLSGHLYSFIRKNHPQAFSLNLGYVSEPK